jgi:3-isopropylmalate dehydrogenase
MTSHKIALMPGDGIGPEIIEEGTKVVETVADLEGFSVEWRDFPHGADHYLQTNELLSEESLKELEKTEAIYFGSIGDPRIKPGVLEQGILLKLRFYFDQYVNLRPVKLFEGVSTPLANKTAKDIDFFVIRENTEDFYVGIGGRAGIGASKESLEVARHLYNVKFGLDLDVDGDEIAYQIGVLSRKGCERVIRYAFDLAVRQGRKKVTGVDKANVLTHMYGMWREVFSEVATGYPDIENEFNFVDAITMWFVKNPEWYDVVVAPNMFGDIITDLGAMIQGGLGLAAGGNINPDGISMFEPIHGSAPKYKGKNVANPLATVWSAAIMLEELGETGGAQRVLDAMEQLLREGRVRTKDRGGSASTSDVGDELVRIINAAD